MDLDARSSCLRAIQLIARSARLCATIDPKSSQYQTAIDSAQRMSDRAQGYYVTMRGDHDPHERPVRLVGTALAEAMQCVLTLSGGFVDGPELEQIARKIERAVTRAEEDLPPNP
jgi:hypothetical protein